MGFPTIRPAKARPETRVSGFEATDKGCSVLDTTTASDTATIWHKDYKVHLTKDYF